jgi:hypothetical protein
MYKQYKALLRLLCVCCVATVTIQAFGSEFEAHVDMSYDPTAYPRIRFHYQLFCV